MTRSPRHYRAAGRVGSAVLRALGKTLRVQVDGEGPVRDLQRSGQPVIYAFWHSRILPLAYLHRNEGIVVLVSRHGDGEYISQVIERLGFGTARGSSTRGGAVGLRGLVRAARDGHDLAFTPDGPRGPAREFKRGVLVCAQLTGAPIVPLAAGVTTAWRLGSWDRLVVPKPFSTIRHRFGAPYYVPREAGEDELERHADRLRAILNQMTDEADGAPIS